ncbi:hypothetical protein [Gluconobacter cerinus]|uniref:hypothetical protein n=1 Tax=Gluconobacter cerinus TaxID=38307 RepID=UPI003AB4774A
MSDILSFLLEKIFNGADRAVKTVFPHASTLLVDTLMAIFFLTVILGVSIVIYFMKKSKNGTNGIGNIAISGKNSINNSKIGNEYNEKR